MPGRPELFATTKSFLDDLTLRSLEELPPLADLGSLVEQMPALGSALPDASDASPGEGLIDVEAEEDAVTDGVSAAESAAPVQLH